MSSLQPPPLSADQTRAEGTALRLIRIVLPIVVLAAGAALWELVVRVNEIPAYVLPGPHAVFKTLVQDWPVLSQSLLTTLVTTLEGFVAAGIGGIVLAVLLHYSEWLGNFFFSFPGVLPGSPGVAVGPLLLVLLPPPTPVGACASVVA